MPKTKKKQESVAERVWKIAVVVLILLLLVGGAIAIIVTAWGGSSRQQDAGAITITPNENGDLVVPTANLTEDFQEVDYGGSHTLLFWRDEDGTIYTAFNAPVRSAMRGETPVTPIKTAHCAARRAATKLMCKLCARQHGAAARHWPSRLHTALTLKRKSCFLQSC